MATQRPNPFQNLLTPFRKAFSSLGGQQQPVAQQQPAVPQIGAGIGLGQAPASSPTSPTSQPAFQSGALGQVPVAQQQPAVPQIQADPNLIQPGAGITGQQPVAPQIGQAPSPVGGIGGSSIVDYLTATGQPADFASRQRMAQELGIQNYTGTAEQNTKMLNMLRGGQAPAAPMTSDGQRINPETGGVEEPEAPAEPTLEDRQRESEDRFRELMELSPEEIAAQQELDQLTESARSAFLGEGERPIPLPFITGRQRAIEERAMSLAQPIQAKAALAQAKRTSALEASKFSLDRIDRAVDKETEAERLAQDREFQERKFKEDVRQFGLEHTLSTQKFNENVRQFGLDLALKERDLAFRQTEKEKGASQAMNVRAMTVLRDVERVLTGVSQAGPTTTNVMIDRAMRDKGGLITDQIVARSPNYQLALDIESIKSNISIDQLQAMREASPTGGALGQIPVRQQEFLMATLGSLRITNTPEILEENLRGVYNIYLDSVHGTQEEIIQAVQEGRISQSDAREVLEARKQGAFSMIPLGGDPKPTPGIGEVGGGTFTSPSGNTYQLPF